MSRILSARAAACLAVLVIAVVAAPSEATETGQSFTSPDATAFSFTPDALGANDEPGQKDLTGHATILNADGMFVSWKWDDTKLSGGNTGDACALFDGDDADANVNAAICVTIAGNPAAWLATRGYTCGNGKNDRCTSTYAEVTLTNSKCKVVNPSDGVFGGTSNKDTQAICKVDAPGDFGESPLSLLNTCSYPSQQPTSDPSDCVLVPGVRETGAVIVTKTGADARCTGAGTPDASCFAAGSRRLNGATFHVGTDTATTYTTTGTGATTGTVCIAGLNTGVSYDVTEDTPPTGYRIEDLSADLGVQSTKSVAITAAGTCTTGSQAAVAFNDSPLSSIQVRFSSPVATGVTLSQITCSNGTNTISPLSENGTADTSGPNRDDTDETYTGLPAGVYTCTIDINP